MKFGLSQQFPCSYIDDHTEQLLVYAEDMRQASLHYGQLIAFGFRRSGEQIYRPHCPSCSKCQSIRLPVEQFQASRSQKRIQAKNKDVVVSLSESNKEDYFTLFETYINYRHKDGGMHPTSQEQYDAFCNASWMRPLFIEFHVEQTLIAVAITDQVQNGLSAMYTFFSPEEEKRSLGTFAILQQIEICQQRSLPYLYLGYQIDECRKMNYKAQFYPHQRFSDDKWLHFPKKEG